MHEKDNKEMKVSHDCGELHELMVYIFIFCHHFNKWKQLSDLTFASLGNETFPKRHVPIKRIEEQILFLSEYKTHIWKGEGAGEETQI